MSHPTNELFIETLRERMEEQMDWQEHREHHLGHPSANCGYCEDNADSPRAEETEEV